MTARCGRRGLLRPGPSRSSAMACPGWVREHRAGRARSGPARRSCRLGKAGDEGSGTLLVIVAVALVLAVGLATMVLGGALHARTRAAAAADLAALAGATSSLASPDHACQQAALVASANGARLTDCEIRGVSVRVRAATAIPEALRRWVPGVREIQVEARAEMVPKDR